jgi:hypothetical protein
VGRGAHKVHVWGVKLKVGAAADENALAKGVEALLLDEFTHGVVVHPRAQRAEKVYGLRWERVHKVLYLAAVQVVLLEDAEANADAVLTGGVPVVLLHAAVADERSIQRREIISCNRVSVRVTSSSRWQETRARAHACVYVCVCVCVCALFVSVGWLEESCRGSDIRTLTWRAMAANKGAYCRFASIDEFRVCMHVAVAGVWHVATGTESRGRQLRASLALQNVPKAHRGRGGGKDQRLQR